MQFSNTKEDGLETIIVDWLVKFCTKLAAQDSWFLELQKFYRRKHLVLLRMSISLFIKSCLLGFMDMQEN